MEDAVSIYFELHPDPCNTFRNRLESELKSPQLPVVFCQLPFSLKNFDLHRRLIWHRISEHLAGFAWDSRISRNEDIHQPAECFDPKRERRYVQQHDVLDLTGKYASLNRGADSDCFIRILRNIR